MKVLHLSAANELSGAGKATLLTHNELLKQGVESRVLFLKSNLQVHTVYSYHKLGVIAKFKRLLITFLDRIPVLLYSRRSDSIFSPGITGINLRRNKLLEWSDIVHIHWANHGFINIKEISSWNKPVIWTLRDMWAFTGGCHHAFDCDKFKNKCGKCPELYSTHEKDLSYIVLERKLKIFKSNYINWVAISSWMQKKAKESAMLRENNISVIPSGVDSKTFYILDKKQIRFKLKLPINKPIILLGASDIRDKYKGLSYAIKVLNKIKDNVLVITFGKGSFSSGEIPQQIIHFGILNDSQLRELYNVSDVFLGPSIAEAMGKTFLEAQLCGLPVVCFEETGPADIVEHLHTGYVAKYKDVDELLCGIEFCLNSGMDRNSIRSRAVDLFDISHVAKAYISIYEKNIVDRASS